MDADSINVIMDEARDYWIAQTGGSVDNFDAGEAISLYCDFSKEELNEIAHYILGWSNQVLARFVLERIAETGEVDGSLDPTELIQMVIETSMPVTMCLTKHRSGNKPSVMSGDKYITTIFAEATVSTAINGDGDLNDIWPQPIVEEVLEKFSPEEAFRIGVLCGQNG